ncbi:MAG: NAD-dependent epimerase/dehydratase family protein [Bacteroidota bacterium]
MNVLVIGGMGFISGALVRRLVSEGHGVTVLTRGKGEGVIDARVKRLVGDRRIPAELEAVVGRTTYDVVYDMIAYQPAESSAAARIFRGKVGRFIHCSTVSVYMVSDAVRCPITEDQDRGPLMDYWERNPFGMSYGIRKRECEDVLWRAHDAKTFPVSMVRPTFVCGPHDPAGRDYFWIERILDGRPLLVPGSGDCAFQLVNVEDVAQALAQLPEDSASAGKAYNVAGEEIFSLNEYLRALGNLLGRSPELFHVQRETFERQPFSTSEAGDVFPYDVRRTAVFSLDRIKRDLGFRPTPFDDWMRKTIDWLLASPRPHSHGYGRREEELAVLRSVGRA